VTTRVTVGMWGDWRLGQNCGGLSCAFTDRTVPCSVAVYAGVIAVDRGWDLTLSSTVIYSNWVIFLIAFVMDGLFVNVLIKFVL
jgi:hypothetical protein